MSTLYIEMSVKVDIMKLRSLKDDLRAAVDLGVVLMIGIAFAGLRN